jgi:hypothetical protein
MIRTIRILAISIALSVTTLQAEVMDITVTSHQQASLTHHFENRQAPVPEPPRNEKIDKFVELSYALAIFLWKNIGYSLGMNALFWFWIFKTRKTQKKPR